MTITEFSDTFTVLVNSYSNKSEFGDQSSQRDLTFNEHEKSVFLTLAQNEFVVGLYSGRNPYGQSFETTEEMRRALNSLVKTKVFAGTDGITGEITQDSTPEEIEVLSKRMDKSSIFFPLQASELNKLLYIIYEQVELDKPQTKDYFKCFAGNVLKVYPVTHDEYPTVIGNPFRGPSRFKVIRIDAGKLHDNNKYIELVTNGMVIKHYLIRYLSKPNPIVLVNLPDELAVDGCKTVSECELPDIVHKPILELAVMKALRTRGINIQTKE